MSKSILNSKIRKSIPSIISFGVITLYSFPASAAQLIEPFELFNIDSNAVDPSKITSMNSSIAPSDNQGNSSSPNGGGGGGGSRRRSSSPFVSSQSLLDSSDDNSSDGTDINNIIPSGFNENFADLIPQDSQINDLTPVTSIPQPNGNNPEGTSDNPTTENPDGDDPSIDDPDDDNPKTDNPDKDDPTTEPPAATPIPEPTSVIALAIIGLVGVLAKPNRGDR